MDKLVSAIITTHNRKELLIKAIDSVLNQTYTNIECIVVDDGSTDNTKDFLVDYIVSNKIHYIYIKPEDSKGGNHARNIGIENSHGEYIAFLDDDDEWLPEKTRKQVDVFEKNNDVGFVFCGRLVEKNFNHDALVTERIKNLEGDLSKEILIRITTTTTTCIMVRKTILLQAGCFDENLSYWQEYEMTLRVLQLTKAICVQENLVLYRVITSDKKRLSNQIVGWEQAIEYITCKHKNLFDTLDENEKALRNLYICIDGFSRARKIKSPKFMCKYAGKVLVNKKMRRIALRKLINKENQM